MDGKIINNTNKVKQKYITYFVFCVLVFATIMKLSAAASFISWFDTADYLTWAKGLQSGLFNAYAQTLPPQYPPIYLFPLFLVGKIYPALSGFDPFVMVLLKSVPIIFDVAGGAVIYILFKNKISAEFAAALAITYVINPAVMYNSTYWGQTDSIMLFIVLCSFFAFETNRPILGTIIFAIGVLTKPQFTLCVPIVLFELFSKYTIKNAAKAMCAGIITGLVVFAPFMAYTKEGILLPFKVYFGTFSAFNYINLNAFNFYGVFNLNWVSDITPLISFDILSKHIDITMHTLSLFITILIIGMALHLFKNAKIKSISLISFIYMQFMFMFTTRMHERYQIVVIAFLLVAFIFLKDKRILLLYAVLSIVIFVNQAALLSGFYVQNYLTNWNVIFRYIQWFFSLVNIFALLYSVYICYDIMIKGNIKQLQFDKDYTSD
jgi:Gpi18-like mannosyltransferase